MVLGSACCVLLPHRTSSSSAVASASSENSVVNLTSGLWDGRGINQWVRGRVEC
jgi:hypothetical protein